MKHPQAASYDWTASNKVFQQCGQMSVLLTENRGHLTKVEPCIQEAPLTLISLHCLRTNNAAEGLAWFGAGF